MPAYEYEALNESGQKSKGVLTGDSAKLVRQILRDRNLIPTKVSVVDESTTGSKKTDVKVGSRQKLNKTDLAVITRQFATLLDSGLTIENTLAGLVEQSDNYRVKAILTGVRSMVMEGYSLADGLRRFPRAFPELLWTSLVER